MLHSEEKVSQMVAEVSREMGLTWKITRVIYRDDYQDYYVILSGSHHCELRQKLVDVYMESRDEDIRKEIEFRLAHAVELEEWEREDGGG